MRKIRLFTNESLAVGTSLALEDNLRHHLDKVLRFKKGMPLTLFNGDGFDYDGELTQLDRQQALVQINQRHKVNNESDIEITLYCAMLKGDIMDKVVQKSVELGVKKLVLVQSKHTEVSFNPSRLNAKMTHWQKIIHASSQQCGRAKIMTLEPPLDFMQAINHSHDERWLFSPHHQPHHTLAASETITDVGVLIGPEGGFHSDEVAHALAKGWRTKSLGARILRADTAAISAVLLVQFHYSQEFADV